jgi:hypothetical protein
MRSSSVAALQDLLSKREHQAFLDELLLAMEDAEPLQLDYLKALGGEGLYLLLNSSTPTPALLAAYANLVITDRIYASLDVVRRLYGYAPSDLLSRHITHTERVAEPGISARPSSKQCPSPAIQLRRTVHILEMGFAAYSASDAIGLRRSVFRSEQERTFLQALALRFPGLHAFPNYPLDQLADFEKLGKVLDGETVDFGRHCRVDAVLVVPSEGDPVAAFGLDGLRLQDTAYARRERLRNRLFRAIQLPFFRLDVDECHSMSVDEWYAILTDQILDKIDCGRRIRVRASHSSLIPV